MKVHIFVKDYAILPVNTEVKQFCEDFNCTNSVHKVANKNADYLVIEVTGTKNHIDFLCACIGNIFNSNIFRIVEVK